VQLIQLETKIAAPPERCFLLSLNIDLHKESTAQTSERAIAGVTHGLIGPDEKVTWEGRHFGFRLTHETLISQYDRPHHFQDIMLRGMFKLFEHDHTFDQLPDGSTLMTDELRFAAPLGPLGRIAERLSTSSLPHCFSDAAQRSHQTSCGRLTRNLVPLRPTASSFRIQSPMSKLAVPVSAKDHTQGPATAPTTLVEYGDYQCPSCGDASLLIQKLQQHFGAKLRFVFRNFPLDMHPYAEHAAETAEFAAAHNKFWEMHDLLFKHQANLADASLLKLATQLKLPAADLTADLEKATYAAHVKHDHDGGIRSGVTGTPMFYLNGHLYTRAYDYDTFVAAIQAQQ